MPINVKGVGLNAFQVLAASLYGDRVTPILIQTHNQSDKTSRWYIYPCCAANSEPQTTSVNGQVFTVPFSICVHERDSLLKPAYITGDWTSQRHWKRHVRPLLLPKMSQNNETFGVRNLTTNQLRQHTRTPQKCCSIVACNFSHQICAVTNSLSLYYCIGSVWSEPYSVLKLSVQWYHCCPDWIAFLWSQIRDWLADKGRKFKDLRCVDAAWNMDC